MSARNVLNIFDVDAISRVSRTPFDVPRMLSLVITNSPSSSWVQATGSTGYRGRADYSTEVYTLQPVEPVQGTGSNRSKRNIDRQDTSRHENNAGGGGELPKNRIQCCQVYKCKFYALLYFFFLCTQRPWPNVRYVICIEFCSKDLCGW